MEWELQVMKDRLFDPQRDLQISTMVHKLRTIKDNIQIAEDKLKDIRLTEFYARKHAEKLFESVNFWALFNTVMILVIGLLQVTWMKCRFPFLAA